MVIQFYSPENPLKSADEQMYFAKVEKKRRKIKTITSAPASGQEINGSEKNEEISEIL